MQVCICVVFSLICDTFICNAWKWQLGIWKLKPGIRNVKPESNFLLVRCDFLCGRKMDVAIRVTKDASPANILIALTDPIRLLAYL